MKSSGNTKYGKKVNVLCIVEWNHERSVVVLDHFRDFKIDSGVQHWKWGGNTYPWKIKLLFGIKKI